MEGLGVLVFFLFFISFGIPAILLIAGLAKWKKDRNLAKVLLILGTAWLIVGGGSCLSIIG